MQKNLCNSSIEYWTLKKEQWAPRLTCENIEQYMAYNTTLKKKCNLCLNEKLAIIDDQTETCSARGQK